MNTVTPEMLTKALVKNEGIRLENQMWTQMLHSGVWGQPSQECACALSHVTIATGKHTFEELKKKPVKEIMPLVIETLGLTLPYVKGYVKAFDAEPYSLISERDYNAAELLEFKQGYTDGLKARKEVLIPYRAGTLELPSTEEEKSDE